MKTNFLYLFIFIGQVISTVHADVTYRGVALFDDDRVPKEIEFKIIDVDTPEKGLENIEFYSKATNQTISVSIRDYIANNEKIAPDMFGRLTVNSQVFIAFTVIDDSSGKGLVWQFHYTDPRFKGAIVLFSNMETVPERFASNKNRIIEGIESQAKKFKTPVMNSSVIDCSKDDQNAIVTFVQADPVQRFANCIVFNKVPE